MKKILMMAVALLLTACTQKEVKQTNETNKNMTTYHKIQVEDCKVS